MAQVLARERREGRGGGVARVRVKFSASTPKVTSWAERCCVVLAMREPAATPWSATAFASASDLSPAWRCRECVALYAANFRANSV